MHIPFSRTFNIWQTRWKLRKNLKTSGWIFSEAKVAMIQEELGDWNKHYLPVNLEGKTVLDVGAGEGETAKFFLDHEATKIVCIEPTSESFDGLKTNTANRNVVALNKRFELSDLKVQHDFLKMEIEGYEEILLGTQLETPAVIEVHGLQLCDKFAAKGYRLIYPFQEAVAAHGCVGYAYCRC